MILEKDSSKVKLLKQKNRIEGGFSLIELLVVMGLLGIVLALATGNFTTLVKSLKTESKVAETETETIVGLEILRQDVEHAGFGLPWNVATPLNWSDLSGYTEAESQTICGGVNITNFDDAPNNAPRAVLSGNNVCGDGSDYLVIKSTVVRDEDESQKWTYLWNNAGTISINSWPNSSENIDSTTRVIAINPKQNKNDRVLVTYGTSNSFYSQLNSATTNFAPKPSEVFLLFGVGPNSDNALRMPFNRADYYVSKSNPPSRCANGTGVLEKAVLSHNSGNLPVNRDPLLDCVADMQIVFGVDQTGTPDGSVDCYTNSLSLALPTFDAQNVRDRVKEVRVYILAHEGQMDRNYRFGSNTIRVGDSSGLIKCAGDTDPALGRNFDLTTITNYQNYRWKVYTLVILPDNLRGR